MSPKKELIAATLFAFALSACAGADTENDAAGEDAAEATSGEMADPTIAPAGEATGLPAGFELRLDRANDMAADFRVMPMGSAMHIQTGPAGVFYTPTSVVESGNYTVSASFTEIGAPVGHREAYGLVIGGSDLQGEAQAYTYFVVRADGSYLIKKRAGAETMTVSEGGWVKSDAVHSATAAGDITNALAIRVEGETAHFSINGTEVATLPVSTLDAWGVAGVRVNHNLNVQVSDWTLTPN